MMTKHVVYLDIEKTRHAIDSLGKWDIACYYKFKKLSTLTLLTPEKHEEFQGATSF